MPQPDRQLTDREMLDATYAALGELAAGRKPKLPLSAPQRTVHYPTLDAVIAARAQARGIEIERSTDAFLREVRTSRPDSQHFGVVRRAFYSWMTAVWRGLCRGSAPAL